MDVFFSFSFSLFFVSNGSCNVIEDCLLKKVDKQLLSPPTHPLMDVRLFGIAIPLNYYNIYWVLKKDPENEIISGSKNN